MSIFEAIILIMKRKTGYVAIVGPPNVGKSTLLNRFLQVKLSVVSEKPQTTIHKIIGIYTSDNKQAIFLDTPGIIKARNVVQDFMWKNIISAVKEANLVVIMVEPSFKSNDEFEEFLKKVKDKHKILVINKIDTVKDKKTLLLKMDQFKKDGFENIYLTSATLGDGTEELKKTIMDLLPEGDFLYPPDQLSSYPSRFFVREIIRGAIFQFYKAEIPYSVCVEIEEFKERPPFQKDYIRASIYVERISQKGILIGKDGASIKKLSTFARKEIEKFLEKEVYLDLRVKVYKNWRKDESFVKNIFRYL